MSKSIVSKESRALATSSAQLGLIAQYVGKLVEDEVGYDEIEFCVNNPMPDFQRSVEIVFRGMYKPFGDYGGIEDQVHQRFAARIFLIKPGLRPRVSILLLISSWIFIALFHRAPPSLFNLLLSKILLHGMAEKLTPVSTLLESRSVDNL
ncbi:MAG: hypothetical protein M5R38_18370 [Candidatus Methylomirabilis sp.]|nr:hypothetical protein [Candidatus Methylomirabilis sp.]